MWLFDLPTVHADRRGGSQAVDARNAALFSRAVFAPVVFLAPDGG
jgi:hypothetical protein